MTRGVEENEVKLRRGYQNHFTLMCPTNPGTFLSIGRGSLWNRVRASELLEVSVDDDDWEPEEQGQTGDSYDSKAVGGYLLDLESSAWVIHAPLHRARPDAAAILHTHMAYTTALASLDRGPDASDVQPQLLPILQSDRPPGACFLFISQLLNEKM